MIILPPCLPPLPLLIPSSVCLLLTFPSSNPLPFFPFFLDGFRFSHRPIFFPPSSHLFPSFAFPFLPFSFSSLPPLLPFNSSNLPLIHTLIFPFSLFLHLPLLLFPAPSLFQKCFVPRCIVDPLGVATEGRKQVGNATLKISRVVLQTNAVEEAAAASLFV